MNEEQFQRAIEFLTQSQADFFAQQAVIEANFKKMQVAHERMEERQDKFQTKLEALAVLTHDLVTVAQFHSRRLDRLDGISDPL